jgi:hypothetical protein
MVGGEITTTVIPLSGIMLYFSSALTEQENQLIKIFEL